jgi:putative ATP-binding cassette transporter
VISNWWQLITAQRNLTLLTSGVGQANGIVPLLVAAPAFFAGRMTLGSVTETQIAYGQVSGALSWFVDAYQEIAAWRANIERLATFHEMLEATRAELARGDGIRIENGPADALQLVHLGLAQPNGTVLAADLNGAVKTGERVALLGPAGPVKTTLFRAIAGLWPFGKGQIELPGQALPLFLPSQPYLPIGTLRDAVCYPSPTGTFSDQVIAEALRSLDLGHLVARLDDSEPWDQQLSLDEAQRLTFARAVLHEPAWVVMDDATGALDEAMEKRVYDILQQRLPRAAVLSITNRAAVSQYHQRHWAIVLDSSGSAALEAG